MRHRARDGDAVEGSREYVGRRGNAGDEERPSRLQASVGSVRPTQAEIDDRPAAGRPHDARGLRGEHRLQMNLVRHERLDELCLRQRPDYLENGLAGEYDRAFRNGEDVSGEPEVPQPVEEARGELTEAGEMRHGLCVERKSLEESEHVVETAGDEEVAGRRRLAHEEVERRARLQSFLEVRLEHLELVEIGEQRRIRIVHPGHSITAPAATTSASARSPSPGATSTARVPARIRCTSKPSLNPSRTVARTQ